MASTMEEIIVVLIGLALGSFLNTIISRLKIDQEGRNRIERLGRRSICQSCQKPLKWYDLIPIVSYLILRGRCRHCHQPIPIYHLGVEILSGLVALGLFQVYGLSFDLGIYLLIGLVMIGILVYDWEKQLIPDLFIWIGFGLAAILASFRLINGQTSFTSLFWGVVVGGGIFYLLYLVSKGRWFGFGDVKLGALLGLILGWPMIAINLWLGVTIGGLVGAGLLLAGKKKLKSQIAFGPFLAVGFLATLFWGNYLWEIFLIFWRLV